MNEKKQILENNENYISGKNAQLWCPQDNVERFSKIKRIWSQLPHKHTYNLIGTSWQQAVYT